MFFFLLQSKEITTTFYDYELQLSKIYTRHVYNRFKETYKSSTIFSICEDTSRNGYCFVEHKVVQIEFPWLQHEFHVKVVFNHQNPKNATILCQCVTWEHTCNK
jgi:hypothetical protein